ncbi:Bacteriophage terminase, large subunit [Moorella glycerini]|uniref:Terminase-like family protein n=1 Tax=Neomoorella stamsii TaxID=1266720 RepID=A0A9X7J1L2_9FIRM|nr:MULTISPECIES: PBSX family phage terminase large subunit [Moorella]PRR69607.1 Terminase-like family protein [Moorella stamsii]CEP67869.1 Bacteriophage terminase, large subunit [Moorella glycerini]CEP68739.1 Bacteriophage terminase, large subunit [Moorella glycerini]
MKQAVAFKFKPFSLKQKKILTWWTEKSPYRDYDMVIADGSIRSGKTISMIDSFITWSLHTFSNQNFILAGKSMGALKRNVLRPMFQILATKGIPYRYHRSEHYIEIGTNTYYCFGANNEASQDVLQGLTAAGALADEVALFPESFVEQMIGRCSVEGSKIWMNCNPEGPYHYIKQDYIDKAKEKRILYLHFTLDDNPALSPKIKERYKRLFSGLWYKRMILGLWVLAEGVIYDMWDENLHLIDCPQKHQEYGVAIDYATATVMTFGLYGITGDKVYLLKEYYWDAKKTGRQKTDSEFAEDFKKFLGDIVPRFIYLDPSAASFKAELRKKGFTQVRDADNDVINGIRLVANFLSTGRFFVDKSCKATVQEFGSYVWDPKAQERGEDKPLKQNDHAMDRNRYFIYSRFGKKAARAFGSKPAGW